MFKLDPSLKGVVALKIRTSREPEPNFLTLPWSTPLEEWPDDLAVRLPRGRHRHVVRFIEHEGHYFALKELSYDLALVEFNTLLYLKESGLPVVDLVGVASERTAGAQPLDSVLITRHLSYSLPYLHLFASPQPAEMHDRLIDSLVVLLVQVHLAGVFWGDCSLGNALFRRDAGSLVAYLVDTETSEIHERLSDGQRQHDIMIATENIAGGLFELEAMNKLPAGIDPPTLTAQLEDRYHILWNELTEAEDVGVDELWRIHRRLGRLNDLGFDTVELEYIDTGGEGRVRFRPAIVEQGHHRRLLSQLTGVEAQEHQARRLLSAIGAYTWWLAGRENREIPSGVGAYRWLTERYNPTMESVPPEARTKLPDPETYIRILDHAASLSQESRSDVDLIEAAADWNRRVLSSLPVENVVLPVENVVLPDE